jgi:hypothetical protein
MTKAEQREKKRREQIAAMTPAERQELQDTLRYIENLVNKDTQMDANRNQMDISTPPAAPDA